MRIDSAAVKMESERSYTSCTKRRMKAAVYPGSKAGPDNGRIGGFLRDRMERKDFDAEKKAGADKRGGAGKKGGAENGDSVEEKDPSGEKMRETRQIRQQMLSEKSGNLKETLEEMKASYGIGPMRRTGELRDTFSTIREKCVDYLMMIFFGKSRPFVYDEFLTASAGGTVTTDYFSFQEEIYFEEQEQTSFSTTGTVKCADGRSIDFQLEVQMSRSFAAYYETNFTVAQTGMCDPLVINLDGNVAKLTDQRFFFDLDADGKEEEIATLGAGSGYLALDHNGDGIINDGSELFGTSSGDGFKDLSAYDEDGDGWIDEDDPVWSRLLIWTRGEDGKDRCCRLSEKGVGAIGLSAASTGFALNGEDNSQRGAIRKTGVFLYENGAAGTVQHVDVAKELQA